MSKNNRIEQLKSILLQLNEFKTEKDVEGLEEIITDKEERKELFDYLFRIQNDCIVAKNTTIGDKHEYYKNRERVLLEAIGCMTMLEKSLSN